MLLQKVGSACGKIALYFKIQRESPHGCGVASYISLIQCYPNSTFMKYVAIHIHAFFVGGVMSRSAEPCDKMHAFSHIGHVCTCVCLCVLFTCACIYMCRGTNYKLLNFKKIFLFYLEI